MSNGPSKAPIPNGLAKPAMAAVALSLALALGGCAQLGNFDLGLGLGDSSAKVSDIETSSASTGTAGDLEKATIYWGAEHTKNPRDVKAALAYAKNLKALGNKPQALGILQNTYNFASDNRELLSEYGRLALEMGQVSTAAQLLERADDPAKPDWRIVSARGTVLAKQGRFSDSIPLYERARQLAPDQPSVLNNLAMAYTMNGQADRGEQLLREAMARGNEDPRIKQNLDLVLSLQGKGAAGEPGAAKASAISTSSTEPEAPPATAPQASPPQQPAAAYRFAPTPASSDWSKPLPIEMGEEAAAPAARTASSKPVDADKVIRAAIKAEEAKAAGR